MKNPIEKSLSNMADVSKMIMERCIKSGGELTQAEILFLSMYQKEKSRAISVPMYRKIIGGIKEVSALIKGFMPDAETSNEPPEKAREIEVDTDAI